MHASIAGVAVWGPGLGGWEVARPVLRGEVPLVVAPADRALPVPAPAILPPNERRRSGTVIRLALEVAHRAAAMAALPPATLRCVFGSANGDGAIVHAILETLAGPAPLLSPTQFHNSVHNAPAGYWTIAVGSRQAATCLGCHDATFATSLLKAMAEAVCENCPVLLCLYDAPLPPPIQPQRPTEGCFAAAFVLVPGNGGPLATMTVDFVAAPPVAELLEPRGTGLRALARANPAARSLRLLEALAYGERSDRFAVELLDGRLDITVQPCSTAATS